MRPPTRSRSSESISTASSTSTPSLGVFYLAFNTRKPPFDDPRVRNALSMVIDREFLADKIWGGSMLPGDSFVPPGIDDYGPPVFPISRSVADRRRGQGQGIAEGGG